MSSTGLLAAVALTGCSLIPGTGGTARADTPPPAGETSAWTMDKPILLPVPDSIADPWAAVKGDKPVTIPDTVMPTRRFEAREKKLDCTAARDHCIPAIAWMWVDGSRPVGLARLVVYTPDGPTNPNCCMIPGVATGSSYLAYRTVPATKANLTPGAMAFAFDKPYPTEVTQIWHDWHYGKVERVDWELGFVFFEGNGEPRMLTATRVAVLSYDGKQLKILGDKKRDQLAVSPKDVILP